MQLPYFQIIALSLMRFVDTARAAPSGALSSFPTALSSRHDHVMAIGVAVNKSALGKELKPLSSRGLPVNIMQNSDDSHPTVPIDNYQADLARLTGDEQ
ncbi:hypothetical protein C8Q79DRAFT_1012998 [Trametes meyenii]|nr:hypothetical protein C8Q79DRAFT_1012998 [Trametes meyenii]